MNVQEQISLNLTNPRVFLPTCLHKERATRRMIQTSNIYFYNDSHPTELLFGNSISPC